MERAEVITVEDLTRALADRGFAALVVVFAAPNLLPLPPGSSTLLSLPLTLVATQMLLGRPRVWLPRFMRERGLGRQKFIRLVTRLEPILARFERLARPRWWPRSRVLAERSAGFVILVMALILLAPVPFGNGAPATAAILIALALVARDGLWLGVGVIVAIGSTVIVAGVIGSIGWAVSEAIR